MNPKPLSGAKDEDVRSVEQALRRAGQNARLLAAQTHTPFVVVRDGQLRIEQVGATNEGISSEIAK
jgi:capsule polysaccharide export protein KpsC/LpsZ